MQEITYWDDLPKAKEGHIGKYPAKIQCLANLISDFKPKYILQTGLNAGHSAALFLHYAPKSKLVSFDNCRHDTVEPAHEVLQKSKRHTLIVGDSKVSLGEYLVKVGLAEAQKPNFIFIDGGHDHKTAFSDISFAKLLIADSGLIVVDDIAIPGVGAAVRDTDWSDFSRITDEKYTKDYFQGIHIYQKKQ